MELAAIRAKGRHFRRERGRDVHEKRRHHENVRRIEHDLVGTVRREAGLELREARVPGRLRHEAARARVIRMAIRGKRREDDARPRAADGLDDPELGRAVRPEAAVPEVERLAEARPEDPRGFGAPPRPGSPAFRASPSRRA